MAPTHVTQNYITATLPRDIYVLPPTDGDAGGGSNSPPGPPGNEANDPIGTMDENGAGRIDGFDGQGTQKGLNPAHNPSVSLGALRRWTP